MHYSDPAIRSEFVNSLELHQQQFNIELDSRQLNDLANYYELIHQHNSLLHLVAPCPPREFATRHILESLTMLRHLPINASLVDLGTGGGLPAIPCLLVREDLTAQLIESKEKKAKFLEMATQKLKLAERAVVINKQFEEVAPEAAEFVTCRAIERFIERLPKILKWSRPRRFLFFGGPSLGEKLDSLKVSYSKTLMPLSQRRYLFTSKSCS